MSKLLAVCTIVFLLLATATAAEPLVGPETEKRFPPLTVPPGFKATLFACDPLIEYPSVISLGPRRGTIFLAHDYVTGLGVDIVRRDEVRLLEDTDADGYADKSTVFAEGFNSIQGLAYHAGTVYAMHAPLLTALRDTNGDGKADERKDLLNGLGLPPEKNSSRLHCANGVAVGHDGWLYLAMGDNGTDVMRPEGDRLVFHEGGILRCRYDGTQLHVFSAGLRNIYDIALDEELNVFVRDNENDGGDYMIRVCHSFPGADHGYPYLYYERPQEALLPLADLGRGSSAGGACYLETAFPPEYRGNLFFCEWGRSVVRYERQRAGSGFAPMKEYEFAAAASNDPYGLKPTDLIVDRDGSLLISDWGDGQRPKRGRGRIYRITGGPSLKPAEPVVELGRAIQQLDFPSYHSRLDAQDAILEKGAEGLAAVRQALSRKSLGVMGRMHAVWIVTRAAGQEAIPDLFAIAESDADVRVRCQAIRAIADLTDPALAGAGRQPPVPSAPSKIAERLSQLPAGGAGQAALEMVVALGRLRWPGAPGWIRENIESPDATLAHALQQTFRRCHNWPDVLALLDEPGDTPLRQIALRAVANQADPVIVDGLLARLQKDSVPARRREYADALTRVYKRPGEWTYWGYRPAPRPANTVAWEKTEPIAKALDAVLADPDTEVRTATLRRMQREQVPVAMTSLRNWLKDERTPAHVSAILEVASNAREPEAESLLTLVAVNPQYATENRQAALTMLVKRLGDDDNRLLALAEILEDGAVLVPLMAEFHRRNKGLFKPFLVAKLSSISPEVRAIALDACVSLNAKELAGRVPEFLRDPDLRVRRIAAAAAGPFAAEKSVPQLLQLAHDPDFEIRDGSLRSLARLRVPGALAAAEKGLQSGPSPIGALEYLAQFGGPTHAPAIVEVAKAQRSQDVLLATLRTLAALEYAAPGKPRPQVRDALAEVQGQSGLLLRWYSSIDASPGAAQVLSHRDHEWPDVGLVPKPVASIQSRVAVPVGGRSSVWTFASEFQIADGGKAQFLLECDCPLEVWLNGVLVQKRESDKPTATEGERFEAGLLPGRNRIAIQINTGRAAQIQLRFRRISSSADHERLIRSVLEQTGDANRGRELFLNAEKSLCFKCHKLGDAGGAIGPNLTGVGDRFSKIHIVESILEPSRTIAPSYETQAVALTSGKTVAGVKVEETETTLSLGDENGKRIDIPKSEIDERTVQKKSTMPDGLEKRLTDREFLDLITFLLSQKR